MSILLCRRPGTRTCLLAGRIDCRRDAIVALQLLQWRHLSRRGRHVPAAWQACQPRAPCSASPQRLQLAARGMGCSSRGAHQGRGRASSKPHVCSWWLPLPCAALICGLLLLRYGSRTCRGIRVAARSRTPGPAASTGCRDHPGEDGGSERSPRNCCRRDAPIGASARPQPSLRHRCSHCLPCSRAGCWPQCTLQCICCHCRSCVRLRRSFNGGRHRMLGSGHCCNWHWRCAGELCRSAGCGVWVQSCRRRGRRCRRGCHSCSYGRGRSSSGRSSSCWLRGRDKTEG